MAQVDEECFDIDLALTDLAEVQMPSQQKPAGEAEMADWLRVSSYVAEPAKAAEATVEARTEASTEAAEADLPSDEVTTTRAVEAEPPPDETAAIDLEVAGEPELVEQQFRCTEAISERTDDEDIGVVAIGESRAVTGNSEASTDDTQLTPAGGNEAFEAAGEASQASEAPIVIIDATKRADATTRTEDVIDAKPFKAGAAGSLAALRRNYNAEPAAVEPQDDSPVKGSEEGLESEWDEVAARTEEMRLKEASGVGKIKAQTDEVSSPISYHEVQQWLSRLSTDTDAVQALQEETVVVKQCLCVPRQRTAADVPGLDRRLWKEKNLVVSLRAANFDFNEITHFRMLRTLYTKLTRNKVCPSIGRHWEVLGFQHTDPRTDLNRSGGVLNVFHLFFFVSHHFEILKAAYLLAQDEQQNFPLACVSINISRMVLESLFLGRLSSLCNCSRTVLETTCKVHTGALFHFYSRWRSLKRTIKDTQLTFNEVRTLVMKQPAKLILGLERGVGDQRAKSDPSRFEFTDLDFGTARAAAPTPPQRGSSAPAARGPASSVPQRLRNYRQPDGYVEP